MNSEKGDRISLELLSQNLEQQDGKEKILEGICQQIHKDFSTFSIHFPLEYSEGVSLQDIFQQLKPVIEHLSNENRDKLRQVIYRIDLSERRLGNLLASTMGVQLIDELSFLIIEREMKKVVLRTRYS